MGNGKMRGGDDTGQDDKVSCHALPIHIVVGLRSLAIGWLHCLVLAAMLVTGGFLYYASVLLFGYEGEPFNVVEGFMHPIILVVPVFYGSVTFGPRVGVLVLLATILLMVPRALFISNNRLEALLEVSSVVLVSGLAILWVSGQKREKERRQEAVTKLETARLELASHIDLITKHQRQLTAINDVCRVVAQSLTLPYILDRIVDKTVDVMGAPIALIFLKDEAGQRLELVAHKGISLELVGALNALQIGEGFNARVAQSGESMVVENASEDPRLCVPQVKNEGIKSQLIVPLRSRGLPIGTLCVALRSSRRFAKEDEEILAAIGSQVGVAIENSRLYREALISEERYRDLFENATVAIFVHDLEGVITAANKACVDLMDYSLGELVGMDVHRLFPAQTLDFLRKLEQTLLCGEAASGAHEVQMVTKSGEEITLFLTTRLISENGHPKGFQHIARDITEQRRMRNTLDGYIRQILTAQEDERRRIAREIHDETAQSLLLISQRLDSLASDPLAGLSAELRRYLADVREVVVKTLADLRRLTQDLRTRILDDLGLVAALEWLADNTEREHSLRVSVHMPSAWQPFRPEAQLLIFRIAQEALSNVWRHAGASQVSMTLEQVQEKARLIVADNGKGFRVPARMADLADEGKLGILGMYERARLLDGTVSVRSEPGKGTVVVAEVVVA